MSGNTTPALVRTGVPMGVGSALIFVAQAFGLELTVDQALILAPVVMWLYYVAGRALESFDPKLGYVLGIAKAPAYSPKPSTSPDRGEDLVAVVVDQGTDPEAVQDVVDESSVSTPVDEPVDETQLSFDHYVESSDGQSDPNVGLLASHAGPSPIDPPAPKKKPAKRAPAKKAVPPAG